MTDDQQVHAGSGGAGPLYEHSEGGEKAAAEPVAIPGAGDRVKGNETPVGEEQAAENRENDPPA